MCIFFGHLAQLEQWGVVGKRHWKEFERSSNLHFAACFFFEFHRCHTHTLYRAFCHALCHAYLSEMSAEAKECWGANGSDGIGLASELLKQQRTKDTGRFSVRKWARLWEQLLYFVFVVCLYIVWILQGTVLQSRGALWPSIAAMGPCTSDGAWYCCAGGHKQP